MATLKELLGDAYKDGMTAEEINTALATKKYADLSTGNYVSKGKYDELNAQLQSRMTEDEKNQQTRQVEEEQRKALEKKLAEYQIREKLSGISDNDVKNSVTSLFVEGKRDEALDAMSTYYAGVVSDYEAKLKQAKMASDPVPGANGGGGNQKKYSDYTMEELNTLKATNPTEYNKIMK